MAIKSHETRWRDVRVQLEHDVLVVENACFRRTLNLVGGLPATQSLIDKRTGFEHGAPKSIGDCSIGGYNMPWDGERRTDFQLHDLRVRRRRATVVHPESLVVALLVRDAVQQLDIVREYDIPPGQPFLSMRMHVRCPVHPRYLWHARRQRANGGSGNDNPAEDHPARETCIDGIRFREAPGQVEFVEFFGRTDFTNELVRSVHVDPGEPRVLANGNLAFFNTDENGLIYIQEALPSSERRDPEPYDFRLEEQTIHSCGSGIAPHEWRSRTYQTTTVHTLCLYHGGRDDAMAALKACACQRFPDRPGATGRITVNPWGGGQFIRKISVPFLVDEIAASGRLRADVYQIDDGWQAGGTLFDLSVNNQASDGLFWGISPERLNGSFREIVSAAAEAGVEPSLWFAPSTNRDFDDWPRMVDLLWAFYAQYGIKSFKLDGIMMRTKRAEDNLERLVARLCRRSNGEIVFNFDTTNGQRPGYWRLLEYGNIFLENRYVQGSSGLGYHPESVLKNFWRLARHVRTQKLQIEIADPGLINRSFYANDGRCQPDDYPATYWAAIALFGNPLVWLNPSALSPAVAEDYRQVFEIYRRHQCEIFTGEIYPVGAEPDGAAIAGFQSWDSASHSGFLILFRERLAPPCAPVALKFVSGRSVTMEELWDPRLPSVSVDADGVCLPTLPEAASFRLLRYRAGSPASESLKNF